MWVHAYMLDLMKPYLAHLIHIIDFKNQNYWTNVSPKMAFLPSFNPHLSQNHLTHSPSNMSPYISVWPYEAMFGTSKAEKLHQNVIFE